MTHIASAKYRALKSKRKSEQKTLADRKYVDREHNVSNGHNPKYIQVLKSKNCGLSMASPRVIFLTFCHLMSSHPSPLLRSSDAFLLVVPKTRLRHKGDGAFAVRAEVCGMTRLRRPGLHQGDSVSSFKSLF